MTEDFLQYLWKLKLIETRNLKTVSGESLQIISSGLHNKNSGPDFSNAKIIINDITWVGNVEIHINSSDWLKHKHDNNDAYKNVILHVVFEDDLKDGQKKLHHYPILELKNHFDISKYGVYESWMKNERLIPCGNRLRELKSLTIVSWLERLFFERLEYKQEQLQILFDNNKQNREEIFYQSLATYFGAPINKEPFEALSRLLPISVLAKHKNNLLQLEALLFGVAGLIKPTDDYSRQLNKEFLFLQKKYKLKCLNAFEWKFGRMRPASFPTIRIAQLALLIHQSKHLYSQLISVNSVKEIYPLFQYKLSDYWQRHFNFGEEGLANTKQAGKGFVDVIILNVIIPFLIFESKLKDDDTFQQKAIRFAEELKAEKNNITEVFNKSGLVVSNAANSQALIQLKNNYCNLKKCLACRFGHELLNMK